MIYFSIYLSTTALIFPKRYQCNCVRKITTLLWKYYLISCYLKYHSKNCQIWWYRICSLETVNTCNYLTLWLNCVITIDSWKFQIFFQCNDYVCLLFTLNAYCVLYGWPHSWRKCFCVALCIRFIFIITFLFWNLHLNNILVNSKYCVNRKKIALKATYTGQ